jgi:hypothetical protein
VNNVSTVHRLFVVYSMENPGGEVVIDPVTATVARLVVVEVVTGGVGKTQIGHGEQVGLAGKAVHVGGPGGRLAQNGHGEHVILELTAVEAVAAPPDRMLRGKLPGPAEDVMGRLQKV